MRKRDCSKSKTVSFFLINDCKKCCICRIFLTFVFLNQHMKLPKHILHISIFVLILVGVNVLSSFVFFRLDLTSEKRYSISKSTKQLLKDLDKPVSVIIYLDGDLNPGFLRLKKAATELLDEFRAHNRQISYSFVNPSNAASNQEREANYERLAARGLFGTTVYDKDNEGKSIQKIIFPWAEIIYNSDTIAVNLLKNIPGKSGNDNLNISIENLEFEFTDALRIKTMKEITKIAFIEGHGELSEEEVYDATIAFSRYFDVHFGVLGNDAAILNPYKAIIIAKPQMPFSEQDKFIIDQYVMNGGRVLWLIDGIRLAYDSLSTMGLSPAVAQQLNLDDMLFKYGVRLAPALLEDMHCTYLPMAVSSDITNKQFEFMPFYYSPLLLTSPHHPVTKNLTEVKALFASAVDAVGSNDKVKRDILLRTSNATRIQTAPSIIDLSNMQNINPETYFNTGYIPVAVALEGSFQSVFTNRMPPQGIIGATRINQQSKHTRMIVVANGDIIRNDIEGKGSNLQILPLGYDKYSRQQFGNRSFILNAILYLTDDEGWLNLRAREFKLQMLNKKAVSAERRFWQMSNVLLPLGVLLASGIVFRVVRRRKYQ